ncbi:MAG: hypothetical protein ACXAEX_13805 [Promethearchaeota archaeon]|jgi:hypothetical protein
MVINQLLEATENLVNQQFKIPGHDIIIGRTPEISVRISNSGQIIGKFKELFNENLQLFLDGKYLKFLELFKRIKGLDENYINEIYQDLELKFQNLADTDDIDTVVLYAIVLNSIISHIRDLNFENTIQEVKYRVKNKLRIKESKIKEELDMLFMKNDENISILYNLSYLDTLAESFNYKKVAHVCKIQKSKYINRVVKLIKNLNN